MAANKYVIGSLILVILTASIYVTMLNKVKITVDNTKSTFYVKEGTAWVVAGVEYNKLYTGTKLLSRTGASVTQAHSPTQAKIMRSTQYLGGCNVLDTYSFDGSVTDVSLFPISHTIQFINCNGLNYQYYVSKLGYSGPTRDATSPESFGRNMKVYFQSGYAWAKVYSTGILKVQYKITSNDQTINVRLFDPITPPEDDSGNPTKKTCGSDGLYLWYPFHNNSASDLSGCGYTGVVNGATWNTNLKAFYLDGTNDFINTSLPKILNKTYTVIIWASNNVSTNWALISKYDFGNNRRAWRIDANGSGHAETTNSPTGTAGTSLRQKTLHTVRTWHMFVYQKNGTYLGNWVDGTKVTSNAYALGTYYNALPPMIIGNQHNNAVLSTNWFQGWVDEVRIYNRTMNDTEVLARYALGREYGTEEEGGGGDVTSHVKVNSSKVHGVIDSNSYGFNVWETFATTGRASTVGTCSYNTVTDAVTVRAAFKDTAANAMRRDMGLEYAAYSNGQFSANMMKREANLVEWAYNNSIHIVYVAAYMPPWLANTSDLCNAKNYNHTCPPTNYTRWGQVVSDFVYNVTNKGLYSSIIEVEVWNEPDLTSFLLRNASTSNTHRSTIYNMLYNATYIALTARFGGIRVGGPALAYIGSNGDKYAGILNGFIEDYGNITAFTSIHRYYYGDNMYDWIDVDFTNLTARCASYGMSCGDFFLSEWNSDESNPNNDNTHKMSMAYHYWDMVYQYTNKFRSYIYKWDTEYNVTATCEAFPKYISYKQWGGRKYEGYNLTRLFAKYHTGTVYNTTSNISNVRVVATSNGTHKFVTIINNNNAVKALSVDVDASIINLTDVNNGSVYTKSGISINIGKVSAYDFRTFKFKYASATSTKVYWLNITAVTNYTGRTSIYTSYTTSGNYTWSEFYRDGSLKYNDINKWYNFTGLAQGTQYNITIHSHYNSTLFDVWSAIITTTTTPAAFTLKINGLSSNRVAEFGSLLNITATFNSTVCIDTTHPSYPINYTCGTSPRYFIFNVSYHRKTASANNANASWCYQESANVSSYCGGLSTGSYYASSVTTDRYFYINYTKPADAILGSRWMVKQHGLDVYNITLPSPCFSSNIIRLRIHSGNGANSYTRPQCYNFSSNAWSNIGIYQSGSAVGCSGSSITNRKSYLYDGNWNTGSMFCSDDGTAPYLGMWQAYYTPAETKIYEEGMWWYISNSSSKNILIPTHQYDVPISLRLNITGYKIGSEYPSDIKVYIDTTLSNTIDRLTNITSATLASFNNSETTIIRNMTSADTGVIGYIRLLKSATVTGAVASVSGYRVVGPSYHVGNNQFDSASNWTSYFSPSSTYYFNGQYLSEAYKLGPDKPDYITCASPAPYGEIYQTIDMTDMDTITYYVDTLSYSSGGVRAEVLVNSTVVTSFTSCSEAECTGDYTSNISAYTGKNILRFRYKLYASPCSGHWSYGLPLPRFTIDNIRENAYPTTPWVEVGIINGTREWNATGIYSSTTSTKNFKAELNAFLVDCDDDDEGYCYVPVYGHSDTVGGLSMTSLQINYTANTNPVSLDIGLVKEYLESSTNVTNIPIHVTYNNGNISIWGVQYDYIGGNATYKLTAHNPSRSSTVSYNVTLSYSSYNYTLPKNVYYLEFIASKPTQKNVTPYGQTRTKAIYNITTTNYANKMGFSILLNETYSCVNLTVSTTPNKSQGYKLSANTWQNLKTSQPYQSKFRLWMWADYACNLNTWSWWEPALYFRGCVNDGICDTTVS